MRSIIPATLLVAVLAAGSGAGCTATVASDPYPPDLVYVSPGVQVIADYDEPIFYSDGLYWRYSGGTWYRSRYYTGGWAYATPPPAVLHINRPYGYVRYRPSGYVARPRGYYSPATPARGGWRAPPAAQARPAEPIRRGPVYQQPARPAPPPPRAAPARPAPPPRHMGGSWR